MASFRVKSLAAAAGLLGAVAATPVMACDPFVAHGAGDTRSVAYVNVGEETLSQGDMRLGGRTLNDDDGEPLGVYSWVSTLQEPPDENGSGTVAIDLYLELEGGQIMTHALTRNTGRFDDLDAVIVQPPIEFAIVGGTGDYARARGISRLIVSGSDTVFVVDVFCD